MSNNANLISLVLDQKHLREKFKIDIAIHRSFSMNNSYHYSIIKDNDYEEEITQESKPNRSYEKSLEDAINKAIELLKMSNKPTSCLKKNM